MKPYNPHPGEILLEEYLKPLKLSQYALAKATGIPQSRLTNIIKGNQGITAKTAILLAKFFENTPDQWLGLQNLHDLREAKHALGIKAEKVRSYKELKVA